MPSCKHLSQDGSICCALGCHVDDVKDVRVVLIKPHLNPGLRVVLGKNESIEAKGGETISLSASRSTLRDLGMDKPGRYAILRLPDEPEKTAKRLVWSAETRERYGNKAERLVICGGCGSALWDSYAEDPTCHFCGARFMGDKQMGEEELGFRPAGMTTE